MDRAVTVLFATRNEAPDSVNNGEVLRVGKPEAGVWEVGHTSS